MVNKPDQIGLFGLFGIGNLGNEGSLEAMHRLLAAARPDAALTCVCANPDVVSDDHGIEALPFNWGGFRSSWARALNKILLKVPGKAVDFWITLQQARRYKILIVPGTGVLDDFTDGPMGMAYVLLKWTLVSRLVGAKFAFVSIGAGPIHHPLSRIFMVWAARMAHYRSFRDQISKDYMRARGLDVSKDSVVPDLAFRLPRATAQVSREPATIGLGVMAYRGWSGGDQSLYRDYIAKLARFAQWLLGRGHKVRLLIGEHTDETAVEDLRTLLNENERAEIVYTPCRSLTELMGQMAETDFVVATRFHNIVCALAMARPSISLGYAAKNDVLLEAFGLEGYSQRADDFCEEKLKAQFEALAAERDAHVAKVRERLADYARRHEVQEAALLALVDGASGVRQ